MGKRRYALGMALWLGAVGIGRACDCDIPPLGEGLRRSAAVFAGEVVALERLGNTGCRVTFTSERWWKGTPAERISLTTPLDGGSCGYAFKVGERYLVYAQQEKGQGELSTSICTRTRPMVGAEEEVKGLAAALAAPRRESPRPVVFSRDGRVLATTEADWRIWVWDTEQGRLLREFPAEPYTGYALSPDGRFLLTSGAGLRGGKLVLWEVLTGKQVWERPSGGHSSLYFTADGAALLLVTGLPTRRPRSYVESLETKGGQSLKLLGSFRESLIHAISPDHAYAALQGQEGGKPVLEVYDVKGGETRYHLDDQPPVVRLALAPGGKRLALALQSERVALWNAQSGRQEGTLAEPPLGPQKQFPDLLFSPDGRLLVTSSPVYGRAEPVGPLRLWDAETGKPGPSLPGAAGMTLPVFSQDSRLLAACNATELSVWNTQTGALVHTFAMLTAQVARFRRGEEPAYRFSADGKLLIAAGEAEVRRWSLETGKLTNSFSLEERAAPPEG